MILLFCFNNLLEVLKTFFWYNWGYDKYIIMADTSKVLKWNLIILKISSNYQLITGSLLNGQKLSWPYGEGNVHSLICTSKSTN